MRRFGRALSVTIWLLCIAAVTWLPQPWDVVLVLLLAIGLTRWIYAEGIRTGLDIAGLSSRWRRWRSWDAQLPASGPNNRYQSPHVPPS